MASSSNPLVLTVGTLHGLQDGPFTDLSGASDELLDFESLVAVRRRLARKLVELESSPNVQSAKTQQDIYDVARRLRVLLDPALANIMAPPPAARPQRPGTDADPVRHLVLKFLKAVALQEGSVPDAVSPMMPATQDEGIVEIDHFIGYPLAAPQKRKYRARVSVKPSSSLESSPSSVRTKSVSTRFRTIRIKGVVEKRIGRFDWDSEGTSKPHASRKGGSRDVDVYSVSSEESDEVTVEIEPSWHSWSFDTTANQMTESAKEEKSLKVLEER